MTKYLAVMDQIVPHDTGYDMITFSVSLLTL